MIKLLILVIAFFRLPLTSVLAITPTPSVILENSPVPDSEIQKIREAVQQKVKEKLAAINTDSGPSKKAIIGTFVSLSQNTITIEYQNSLRNITVSSDTVYIDTKRNKTSLDKIKAGQGLLSLGYLNPDGTFDAKRIVFIDLKTIDTTSRIVAGKIVDLSQSSSVMVIISPKDKDSQYQILINSKTDIVNLTGKNIETKNLKNGLNVIAIISPESKSSKSFVAEKIILTQPLLSPTPSPKKP